jgi:hypothetical protein
MAYGLSPCGYVSCQFLGALIAPFDVVAEADPYSFNFGHPVTLTAS